MIPLFVDCSGRRIVIFGGGNVAARKAAYFSGTCRLTVVSRSFVKAFDRLDIERCERDLGTVTGESLAGILEGTFLAIAALPDPALNNRIGRACREQGILFNNADGEAGDVILPAISRGDQYTLAISTGGSSPAISRFIREHLERELPALDAMIALQGRLRESLKRAEPDQARRNVILRKVLDDPGVWQLLGTDQDKAWEQVAGRYLHD
jgi:precorrin-2 dehydrogenase / sirohydrochlorin ferrochelatase